MATMQRLYIAFAKWSFWVKKIKFPKTCEKRFYKHITDVLCKKTAPKTFHIREIRRFWKLEKWPLCKGYSLCKMVILGQKIKLPKTCEKRFYKHITDVLYKKRLLKTPNIWEWHDFENWKNGHYAKAIAFAKWSFWVKG